MLFESQAKNIVQQVLSQTQKAARREYDARVREMDCFYGNDHAAYMCGDDPQISITSDGQVRQAATGTGWGGFYLDRYATVLWRSGQVYPAFIPILSRFAQLMATLFHDTPEFKPQMDGLPVDAESTNFKRSMDLLSEVDITTVGKQAQRKSLILATLFAYPRFYRGKMHLDLVTPDKIQVLEDPMSPSVFQDCLAVMQEIPGREESIVVDPVTYLIWTREPQADGSDVWAVYHVAKGGKQLPNPWFPDNVNPFGRFPHVRLVGYPSPEAIFAPMDETLHAAQIGVNLAWTHILHCLRRSDGTGVLIDRESTYTGGLNAAIIGRVMHLQGDADFKWEELKVNLSQLIESVTAYVKTQAGFRGIPTDMLSLDGPKVIEALSAQSKAMDRLDLVELRSEQKPLWDNQFADLWDSLVKVNNHYRPTKQIDESVTLAVDWQNPEPAQDPQAKAQADNVRIGNRIVSPVDIILEEHPGWTEEQARAKYIQNLADTQATDKQKFTVEPGDTFNGDAV